MGRGAAIGFLLVLAAPAGCFAPFSWPEDRHHGEVVAGTTPAEPAVKTPAVTASRTTATTPAESAAGAADDGLSRAADCLEHGDEAGALPHLRAHVRAHPDAVMIRAHLAELLFRLGKPVAARAQYEQFVADAQQVVGPANNHLVHCHTRLMEIAQADDDDFHEQLHRGIGLVLLVKRWDDAADRTDAKTCERTLTKALAALRAALEVKPTDPRGNLYLAEALDRLGQVSAARTAYRTAHSALPDPAVTPAERERIEIGAAAYLQ